MIRKAFVDFQAVKALITVRQYLERTGWRCVWSRGELARGPCPVHGSTSRTSRALTVTARQWYCHKCHKGGDVTRLYATLNGCTDYEAAVRLCEEFRVAVPTRPA